MIFFQRKKKRAKVLFKMLINYVDRKCFHLFSDIIRDNETVLTKYL